MAMEYNELLVNLLRNNVLSTILKLQESKIQSTIRNITPEILESEE